MKEEKEQTPRTTEEIFVQGCASIIVWMLILVCFAIMCFLSGCTTTKYVEVPGPTHTDTLLITQQQRDSIHVHDSIYVSEAQHGDTILLTKERWHTAWRDRWRTDTIYRSRVDSVPFRVEVPVEVPAKLTWWQQLRIHLGGIAFWLLILAAGVGAFKLYRKFH